MVYHFLANHSFGETCLHLHADNFSGQNKNRFMMAYLMWRIIGASLSEPHTSRSRCERRTCIASTKIYDANTESPTLGGHQSYERRTSVSCTKILNKKMESPHLGVYTRVNCRNTVRTRRARTRGEVWRHMTEKNDLEGEGSVRD